MPASSAQQLQGVSKSKFGEHCKNSLPYQLCLLGIKLSSQGKPEREAREYAGTGNICTRQVCMAYQQCSSQLIRLLFLSSA